MPNDSSTTWIVTDHIGAGGALDAITEPEIRVLSRSDLQANPHLRFQPGDKVCLTSETVLAEVLGRMDDPEQYRQVLSLKDKLACRRRLALMYPDFTYKTIKLWDLPWLVFDPGQKYVVKPVRGYFGSGVRVIERGNNLHRLADEIKQELQRNVELFSEAVLSPEDFIIEEFIQGEEYAVDMFYSSTGRPVIVNLYHHPIPPRREYLDVIYYTSAQIFEQLYEPIVEFFTRLNQSLDARSLPIHAEFKYDQGRLTPVELNPLRYGSDGLHDLVYHAFGLNPFVCFARDIEPDWPALWRDKKDKFYAFYFAYNGANLDVATYRPHLNKFYGLFSKILSDFPLDYHHHLGFRVLFLEESSLDRIMELVQVEFKDYFINQTGPSEKFYRDLCQIGLELHREPGLTLWQQGELGDFLFLVLDGSLDIYLQPAEGLEVLIDCLGPGSLVGELSVMDGLPRSATVKTKTNCVLLRVPGPAFRALLRRTPDILEELYWQQVHRVRQRDRLLTPQTS
jgi:CRP-like cAMP-binding protein